MVINSDALMIIILTVLIYLFEHKILPTLITGFLSLYIGFSMITATISESDAYLVFAYVLVFFYACYMMAILSFITPEQEDKND